MGCTTRGMIIKLSDLCLVLLAPGSSIICTTIQDHEHEYESLQAPHRTTRAMAMIDDNLKSTPKWVREMMVVGGKRISCSQTTSLTPRKN